MGNRKGTYKRTKQPNIKMIPPPLRLEGSLGGDLAMERVRGAGVPFRRKIRIVVVNLTLVLTLSVAEGCGHDEGV